MPLDYVAVEERSWRDTIIFYIYFDSVYILQLFYNTYNNLLLKYFRYFGDA